jgi:hypothetical protein
VEYVANLKAANKNVPMVASKLYRVFITFLMLEGIRRALTLYFPQICH